VARNIGPAVPEFQFRAKQREAQLWRRRRSGGISYLLFPAAKPRHLPPRSGGGGG
jgi:hypothetical protein